MDKLYKLSSVKWAKFENGKVVPLVFNIGNTKVKILSANETEISLSGYTNLSIEEEAMVELSLKLNTKCTKLLSSEELLTKCLFLKSESAKLNIGLDKIFARNDKGLKYNNLDLYKNFVLCTKERLCTMAKVFEKVEKISERAEETVSVSRADMYDYESRDF